jgi:hypothetical protein
MTLNQAFQRICFKLCFKVGQRSAETHSVLREVYGNMLSQMKTYRWCRCFKNWRTSADDDEWSGGRSASKIQTSDCPGKNILGNRWLSEKLQKRLEYPLVHATILMEDLGMHRVSAKFVPRLLTDDLQNVLQRANDGESLLKNVITSNETWVYSCDIETKQQSSHRKSRASSHLKKACEWKQCCLLFFFWSLRHCA